MSFRTTTKLKNINNNYYFRARPLFGTSVGDRRRLYKYKYNIIYKTHVVKTMM